MATSFNSLTGGLAGSVTTGAVGNYGQTWVTWNQIYFSATTVTVNQTWAGWNDQLAQCERIFFEQPNLNDAQIQTAATEACKKQEAAKKRAEEFLLENLSPAQRESYRQHGLFIVETQKKTRYKLNKHAAPRRLEGDKEIISYCIHTHGVPKEDELLGFKLLLEANEDEFLKTANATRLAA